ncbi:MAG: SDR family NAD(P)-dependent oxidoreductase [Planctomycetota bacterium]
MARRLDGKSIIITGASSGIGRATALACADAGMDVVINARRADRLETLAADIRSRGRTAVVVPGDCTDSTVIQSLIDRAATETSGVYAVYANAGYGLSRSVANMSETELRDIYEVNFFSSASLIQRAARHLLERDEPGHMLMCSSCLAKLSVARHGAYSGTKAAQNHLCRAMRQELRKHNIEVASVHPITTTTEFFEVSDERSGLDSHETRYVERMPKPWVQTPERVARAIVKCLRRPKPEVWTSLSMRLSAAFITAFPGSLDLGVRFGPVARQIEPTEEPAVMTPQSSAPKSDD